MTNKECRKCGKVLENESIDGYCKKCWNKYHSFNNVATITKTIAMLLALIGIMIGIYCILELNLLIIGLAFILISCFLGNLSFAMGELIFKMQNVEDNTKNNR